ncbi:MAG: hypothetical protein PHT69_14800, partial [Bacteroidales bacterium]|nr:hypothetical protein [Bacteroidales bacterium]
HIEALVQAFLQVFSFLFALFYANIIIFLASNPNFNVFQQTLIILQFISNMLHYMLSYLFSV